MSQFGHLHGEVLGRVRSGEGLQDLAVLAMVSAHEAGNSEQRLHHTVQVARVAEIFQT